MKVLIACEFSGRVRDRFAELGHDVGSCDLLPSDSPGLHYQGDVRDVLTMPWDMIIAFPPCTHLSSSGARWWPAKIADGRQASAISFAELFWGNPCPRIAIENPVGCLSTRSTLGKPSQVVHPWWFGEGFTKATCLWLKGLPLLTPTDVVTGRVPEVWRMPPSPDRAKRRSLTYEGLAKAMASQWGGGI